MPNTFFRRNRAHFPKRSLWFIFLLLIIVSVSFLGVYLIIHNQNSKNILSRAELATLWNSGNIEKTLTESRKATESFPFDEYYLSIKGISSYYWALNAQDEESRQQLFEESVVSLRKALAVGVPAKMRAQIYYVLAKAYYQKGDPWFDMAERYFLLAKDNGSKEQDIPQYLAIVYAGKKDYARAADWFELALKNDASDPLLLSAAITYNNINQKEKSRDLLLRLEASASDAKIRLKAKLLLAQDSFDAGDISAALQGYQEVLKEDPLNVDAWYGLGLVYSKKNDQLGARAAFRKVVQIDPNHADARRRLAEKL
ncbi:MAG: tetratricopeptide repeat protein [Rectinema sp.]|uniref:Putative Tetratricopeptide repeat domain protein n=1 Tax=uncultured spirochete TaxID=156406 RepID=A0A3P3XTM9_9SPIR|nr:putative Tetratricopeptide repeat domain protein [uncultured spirochete]